MKLSVSLPEDDVAFIDEYASRTDVSTRSGVLRMAVELLRASELEEAYGHAWDEWSESAESELWEGVAADGLRDQPAGR